MKKQSLVTAILAVALVISVTLNVILCVMWPHEKVQTPVLDPVDAMTTTTIATIATVHQELVDIVTPYGTVKFPAVYTDVTYQSREADGIYTLEFFYLRDGDSVDLYAVHFGDEDRGTLIGYIRQGEEDIPFTVTSADATVDEDWSTEEQEHFKNLSMAINDVIASIQAWETYTP